MLKRFASAALVAALICSLGGTSAFADTAPQPDNKSGEAAPRAGTGTEAGKEAQANEKLKADILKRVADAKAGKTAMAFPRPQQPPQRNNLSKGQKIAIGVGIAVAVIVVAVAVAGRNTPGRVLPNF